MCLVIDGINQRGSVAVMGVFFPWLGQSLEQGFGSRKILYPDLVGMFLKKCFGLEKIIICPVDLTWVGVLKETLRPEKNVYLFAYLAWVRNLKGRLFG